jgi:hypothetical protein
MGKLQKRNGVWEQFLVCNGFEEQFVAATQETHSEYLISHKVEGITLQTGK